ncbi:DUF397 domain-containing protein [Streptomyces purpurogeneiscleroticus]|uniref:DUF397 domain-containing protein n=1 Tax=Streptomyces purpurogeneiscleroticus TaxID=68259 RepID=UPI001CBC7FE9|nr:DUF397 domain-containing protein [Streptomyces purpurogeneiscleroticus]MBZ4016499.1 hypothetical protein [Streptomyces purpurogeneiscleroticus]
MGDGATWFTSSYSEYEDAACVEVAIAAEAGSVQVRDSKRVDGAEPRLTFSSAAWSLFIAYTTAD